MEVVVVNFAAWCFGHGTVDLISVHDSREDILLTTHDLNGCFVGILIELLGELVATVIVKIGRVDIKDRLSSGWHPASGRAWKWFQRLPVGQIGQCSWRQVS